jgi:signal transduction histidine kinase
MEKERLDEHRKILEEVTKSVNDKILNTEESFLITISDHHDFSQSELTGSIDSLKNLYPLIEEVFLFDNTGEIQLPFAKLLYYPDGSTQPLSSLSVVTSSGGRVYEGQRFEFQERNYSKAIISYRGDFQKASDTSIKGELLNAIGRVLKKSSLFEDAIETYKIITRDYNNIQTTGGVPLGLAARSEINSLYMATGDTLKAVSEYLSLFKDLLDNNWILERAQFIFFSLQIGEAVDNIFLKSPSNEALNQYRNDFTLLKEEEGEKRQITERLLAFRKDAAQDVKARIPLNPTEQENPVNRFTLESSDNEYLVSLSGRFLEIDNAEKEIPGLLLNATFLRDTIIGQALRNNIYSGRTGWMVKGRGDRTILQSKNSPSGSVSVRTNFEGGFPPWFVELYQNEPDLFQRFLFSRRGIYFFMFILLAGILIYGLILTTRTIARELELSRMKSDFVSTISHEFKSPLSSIRQLSEMLQSGRVPSEEYRQQYYDVLVEQSERLSLLIDNILDFSKIEEGKKEFDFRMIGIDPLLHDAVSAFQDQVRHKNFDIQLKIDEPLPRILADRAAISQAVTNLIDNAVKYSGDSRKIIVGAFAEDRNLVIEVEDFGIGISKEEINKIFERFYRVGDELTRQVKGSGLGLTLAKHIVEAHGGTIEVVSEVGKGSRFTIRLPLERP